MPGVLSGTPIRTSCSSAIDRFAMEVKRQLDVLDRRLGESAYVAGNDYTVADIAIWPWYGGLAKGWQYGAADFLQVPGLQECSTLGGRHQGPKSCPLWRATGISSRRAANATPIAPNLVVP
jgi:hypothetical protein